MARVAWSSPEFLYDTPARTRRSFQPQPHAFDDRRPPARGRKGPPAAADDRATLAGGNGARATPVPIPNTVVKPRSADGTARETEWESTSSPALMIEAPRAPIVCSGAFLHPGGTTPRRQRSDSPLHCDDCYATSHLRPFDTSDKDRRIEDSKGCRRESGSGGPAPCLPAQTQRRQSVGRPGEPRDPRTSGRRRERRAPGRRGERRGRRSGRRAVTADPPDTCRRESVQPTPPATASVRATANGGGGERETGQVVWSARCHQARVEAVPARLTSRSRA